MRPMARALVIHPGALGDVLLAAPALAHLRTLRLAPTLAVASHLVGLWGQSGLVERAIDLEALQLHRLFVEPVGGIAMESLLGYDAVVSWLGAGDRVYRSSLRGLACPVVIARAAPSPDTRDHVSQHLLDTLAPLGPVPASLPEARLGVAAASRAEAAAWLTARGIRPGEAVALQPGAGSAAKVWPGYGALAGRLRAAGVPVIAHAGPADAGIITSLVTAGVLDVSDVARDWPLTRVAALFTLVGGTVGNDSGPTHLAAAVGCPTVALFGPTDPARWAPPGRHVRVVAGRGLGAPWEDVGVERVAAVLRELRARAAGDVTAIRMHAALGFAPSGHIDNLPQGTRELLFYRRVPSRRI